MSGSLFFALRLLAIKVNPGSWRHEFKKTTLLWGKVMQFFVLIPDALSLA